jgi:hypothetical protein
MKRKRFVLLLFVSLYGIGCGPSSSPEYDFGRWQNWRETRGLRKVPSGWKMEFGRDYICWKNPELINDPCFRGFGKKEVYFEEKLPSIARKGVGARGISETDSFYSGRQVAIRDPDSFHASMPEEVMLRYYISEWEVVAEECYYFQEHLEFDEAVSLSKEWCGESLKEYLEIKAKNEQGKP